MGGSEKEGGVSRGAGSAKEALNLDGGGGRGTAGHAVAPFCGGEYSSANQTLCTCSYSGTRLGGNKQHYGLMLFGPPQQWARSLTLPQSLNDDIYLF